MPRKKQQPPADDPSAESTASASAPTPPTPAPAAAPPPAPSPAVLSLQQQVVDLVSQRTDARQRLTDAHQVYLLAQSKFQAAQTELQGIEQEVQYRIGLIAQLENRTPSVAVPPPQTFGAGIQGVSVEPAPAQRGIQQQPGDNVSRGHASRDPNALMGHTMM